MRSMWKGFITFGLVNIPVFLYKGFDESSLNFRFLHKKDFSKIKYDKVCERENKEVPKEEIARGFEYKKDEFVILTNKDFEKANVRKTKTIEIIHFAKEDEIDSTYFKDPYFLEPEKGTEKAYIALREALKKTKKVGVAKFILAQREHLGIVKPKKNIILLNKIRFYREIRKEDDLRVFEAKLGEQELNMAINLVNQATEPFSPKKYRDTYVEDLKEIIKEKTEGKAVVARGEAPSPTAVSDLMETLKESLRQREHLHKSS